jgi:DNA-binding transcriptional LysR family regulator
VADANQNATGTLKIAAPVPFGLIFVSSCVARFQVSHPAMEINLALDDRPVDLVEENVDVAIRLGHLVNPGLVARKLGESPFVAVASPAYLSLRGMPRSPKDLETHNCLAYTQQANPTVWEFEGGAASYTLTVGGNYRSNNLLALKDAAVAGIGIACLPLWMVDAEIKLGLLRLVLENARLPAFGIHAVFPSASRIPDKVKMFVDFMQGEFSSVPYFLGVRPPLNRSSSK